MSKKSEIWAEMARRKVQFHNGEEWQNIRLWGLFNWGDISKLIKSGELITDMRKENKVVWVWPSEESYERYIKPLIFTCVYCDKEISTNEFQRYPSEDARVKECYCGECFMRNSVER